MQKYVLLALLAIDTNGVLPGIMTANDACDVAVEAATEDIQKGRQMKQGVMTINSRSHHVISTKNKPPIAL